MKWQLARRHQIGGIQTLRIGAETKATVLQTDAIVGLNHARTKAHVVTLNEADHHAVFVGCREIDGTAFDRIARFKVLRFFHINELCATF